MHLATVSWISLAIGCLSAAVIVIDEFRRPQKMAVMNVVWPISALYFSLFALWAYYRIGRESVKHGQVNGMSHGVDSKGAAPTWSQVAVGTSHCGAGCVVADVCTEFGIAAAGLTLFGSSLLTSYVLDYVAAWAIGIAFQYFAIRPMRHDLSTSAVLWAAIKADTLSITAFQIGMYAWMALVFFKLFPGSHLTPFDPRYWFMMQIAMACGFATSFPMNRFLIKHGLKETM